MTYGAVWRRGGVRVVSGSGGVRGRPFCSLSEPARPNGAEFPGSAWDADWDNREMRMPHSKLSKCAAPFAEGILSALFWRVRDPKFRETLSRDRPF